MQIFGRPLNLRVAAAALVCILVAAFSFSFFSSFNLTRTRPSAPDQSLGYVVQFCSAGAGARRCAYVTANENRNILIGYGVTFASVMGLFGVAVLHERASKAK